MERINFDYSLKNIPIPDKRALKIKLFDATSKYINRMRWKAHFCGKDDDNVDGNNQAHPRDYKRFPSRNSAPECAKLIPFESDLWRLVKSIKFRDVKTNFQSQLKHDLREITKTKKVITFADKTANLYGLCPNKYNKIVKDNITKEYKTAEEGTVESINDEAWSIIKDYEIKGKVPKFQLSDAFVTLKDHKSEFPRITKCRLINPSKTHIAKISKAILDRVANDVRKASNLTQWKNSREVVSWFNNINHKGNKCFVSFDIVEFYPSIKEQQLTDALEFAKRHSEISDDDIRIVMHSCKSILSYDNKIWRKKT